MICVVLCEDLQSFVFIRRALKRLGVPGHNIRERPFPDSTFQQSGGTSLRRIDDYDVYACGSQHVRENVAREIAYVRTGLRGSKALVVHIDVDNTHANGRSVRDRKSELDLACSAANVPPRAATEPIAILVPRRNIETWIENLATAAIVHEHQQYPKLTDHEADCGPMAELFADHAKANTTPPNASPSLVDGLAEIRAVI